MSQNSNLAALSAAGVSVRLDDPSRERLLTGNLAELVATRGVVDVTPTRRSSRPPCPRATPTMIRSRNSPVVTRTSITILTATTDDVRLACGLLTSAFAASDGVAGRVSIEVDPRVAHDADRTVEQAAELCKIVDRPNLLIKIPASETRPAGDHLGDPPRACRST